MLKATLGAVLALAAGVAYSADNDPNNGPYIGAAITEVALDGFDDALDLDEDFDLDDTSWKVFVGWRFMDFFSTELNYMDLGSEQNENETARFDVDARAITALATGIWPLPYFDLYAKAGLAWWDVEAGATDLSVTPTVPTEFDEDDTEFAWGAGAQARWRGLGFRLEYENIDIGDTDGLDLISLGVSYTFPLAP